MRATGLLLAALALSACAAPTAPSLVSTQSPSGTGVLNENSPLQTLNSLPPGAANLAPNSTAFAPDFAHVTLRAF